MSDLGRHGCEDRRKSVRSVLDRLSQTLVIRCNPVHQLLGYSVAHCFRESARFFGARAPMRGRITGHDASPCCQSRTSQASSAKMSMFVPAWCVDVLWISFFSVSEINNEGKPLRGRPVSSCHLELWRPARCGWSRSVVVRACGAVNCWQSKNFERNKPDGELEARTEGRYAVLCGRRPVS